MKKKVTAIIQARMNSTRLPGKVMIRVLDKPLMGYLIERLQDARTIEQIILATTTHPVDDPVAQQGSIMGIPVFRGSENNVLSRYYEAAKKYSATNIMRITADCPLIDPHFLDLLVDFYFSSDFDYVSNCEVPTLPDGLDAEIFSFEVLQQIQNRVTRPSCREHVTTYIRNHPNCYNIGCWYYSQNLSHLRWTVDEPCDLQLVRQVIETLYPIKKDFRTADILDLLSQHPEWMAINNHIIRNEGFFAALETEKNKGMHIVS